MFTALYKAIRIVGLGILNVRLHKLRSGLTVLGIVFGVCSVISMLSIGEGASREVLDQIKRLGSQNIIIRSAKPPRDPSSSSRQNRGGPPTALDYGLRYADAERLVDTLPSVKVIVPIKSIDSTVWYKNREAQAKILGTVPWYGDSINLTVTRGRFITTMDMHKYANVCVIGERVARQIFLFNDPIGQTVKIGRSAYRVVGVAAELGSQAGAGNDSGGENLPSEVADVLVPLTTLRSLEGDLFFQIGAGTTQSEYVELHEIVLTVDKLENVMPTSTQVESILKRNRKSVDFQMIVPLRLMEQARRTQAIFSIVLGSIAAISLLVGGIGIMNIMLASVSERTREIGIRRALGARQRDIMLQFLVECLILSLGGGIIGMALGAGIPLIVTRFSGMPTVLTANAFILSFAVSAAVGIVFGLYPARRAAVMDPIEALRHE